MGNRPTLIIGEEDFLAEEALGRLIDHALPKEDRSLNLDVLDGGNGPDTLDAQDGAAGDVLDGGKGQDECLADAGETSTNCP